MPFNTLFEKGAEKSASFSFVPETGVGLRRSGGYYLK